MAELSPLSRGTDHLNTIRSRLAELTGTASLASELLQNADDAGASICRFTIDDRELRVWNDQEFKGCEQLEVSPASCPWLADHGHRCDFHSFRNVGAADKQSRSGVTGAFGIGFLAVYQATDHPELISAGQHWLLDEMADESARVRRATPPPNATGTEFVLPWVFDNSTALRRALNRPGVLRDFPDEFARELIRIGPDVLMFLQHVKQLEVVHSGTTTTFARKVVGDLLTISGPEETREWLLLHGDFDEAAATLRSRVGPFISPQRPSSVTVAVSASLSSPGRLYVTLPTEATIGIGVHINASFFPRNDRKGILFGTASTDVQHEVQWNRAAMHEAARIVGANLERLPEAIGFEATWRLLVDARQCHQRAADGTDDVSFGSFFTVLQPLVTAAKIARATDGTVVSTGEILLPLSDEIYANSAAAEELGLRLVAPELRSICFVASSNNYPVPRLTLARLNDALTGKGFESQRFPDDQPNVIADENLYGQLLRLSQQLLAGAAAEDRAAFRKLMTLPATDGWRECPASLARATESEVSKVGSLIDSLKGVLDEAVLAHHGATGLAALVDNISVEEVVEALEGSDEHTLEVLAQDPAAADRFLAFLESHREDAIRLAPRISVLPVIPSGQGFARLADLALPGGFQDELGVADLVDLAAVADHTALLRDLGAKPLDLRTYLLRHVASALRSEPDPATVARIRTMLVLHLGELADDDEVLALLGTIPLVEDQGGRLREAKCLYFPGKEVTAVLGEDAPVAARPQSQGLEQLLDLLGVRRRPDLAEVLDRCATLVSAAPTAESIGAVERIFVYVAERHAESSRQNQDLSGFARWRTLPWLPREGPSVTWQMPTNVDAVFNRAAFASTGDFLAFPLTTQNSSSGSDFLRFLGVTVSPPIPKVVQHLLNLSASGDEVPAAVYFQLNQSAADPAVERLRGQPCLYFEGDAYVRPADVFWGGHPFGGRRFQLDGSLRQYQALLDKLGVKQEPDAQDAIDVLREVSHHAASDDLSLDDRQIVMGCWTFLTELLGRDAISEEVLAGLASQRLALDGRGMLAAPQYLLFDNMPEVDGLFTSQLRHVLVKRPPGAWTALRAAGVRDLASAVTTRLVDSQNAATDEELSQRLAERVPQLHRYFESRGVELRDTLAELLESLEVQRTDTLIVEYSLDHAIGTAIETAQANAVLLDGQLLHRLDGTEIQWSAISRVLEQALLPSAEPGELSLGLKIVLQGTSGASVDRELDMLGVAQIAEQEAAPMPGVAGELGSADGDPEIDPQFNDDGLGFDESTEPGQSDRDAVEAGDDRPGEGSSRPPGATGGEASTRPPRPPATSTRKQRRTARFVGKSYVAPESTDSEDTQQAPRRAETERAAVDAALEYERQSGRTAEEMPPANPGFDIASRDANGQIVRWIEVKGLRSSWGSDGVELTPREYQEAVTRGDQYWLYVVDDANREDLRVLHTIANPVSRIGRYIFDDGWRNVADAQWQALPELPEVALHEAEGPSLVRYFTSDEIVEGRAPSGFVRWSSSRVTAQWLAVQVTNRSAGSGRYGEVIAVEPLDDGESADQQRVLVDLSAVGRSFLCGPVTTCFWMEQGEGDVLLDLGPLGDEVLQPHERNLARVLGFVHFDGLA